MLPAYQPSNVTLQCLPTALKMNPGSQRGLQGRPVWLDPQLLLPLVSKPGLQPAAGLSSPSLLSCPGLHTPRAPHVLSLLKWLLPSTLLSCLSLTSLCWRYLTFLSAHHSYPLKRKRSDFPWTQPSSKNNQAGHSPWPVGIGHVTHVISKRANSGTLGNY